MIERLGTGFPATEEAVWEWEPAGTLSQVIQQGLDRPRRHFAVYLKPKRAELTNVILGFTADDQLVLGLSIDDEGMRPENAAKAKELLYPLIGQYRCHLGMIAVEQPPPRD